jgi:hypothetical protein
MSNGCRVVAALALAIAIPSAARAQRVERGIEIGAGAGVLASWWVNTIGGADLRVTVPVSDRGDIEVLGGAAAWAKPYSGFAGFYGVQFRQHLRGREHAVQPFMTYGAIGLIDHDRSGTEVSPPFIPMVGTGVERPISRRVLVRVEAQPVFVFVVPVAVRVAAGVSIRLDR